MPRPSNPIRTNDDPAAPRHAPRKRHGDKLQTLPHVTPPTDLRSSRVADAALVLACLLAFATLGVLFGALLDALPDRQLMLPLALSVVGSFLTATVAALGWMHARKRRDGGIDPTGLRRARIAGLLAGIVLVAGVVMLGSLGTPTLGTTIDVEVTGS